MTSTIEQMFGDPNDFFINLGNHAFFGAGARIKDLTITHRIPDRIAVTDWDDEFPQHISDPRAPVEITITAIAPDISLVFNATDRISLKMVRDCSIDELIFAIREKIRRGEL
jgi:hypothetical protein